MPEQNPMISSLSVCIFSYSLLRIIILPSSGNSACEDEDEIEDAYVPASEAASMSWPMGMGNSGECLLNQFTWPAADDLSQNQFKSEIASLYADDKLIRRFERFCDQSTRDHRHL